MKRILVLAVLGAFAFATFVGEAAHQQKRSGAHQQKRSGAHQQKRSGAHQQKVSGAHQQKRSGAHQAPRSGEITVDRDEQSGQQQRQLSTTGVVK